MKLLWILFLGMMCTSIFAQQPLYRKSDFNVPNQHIPSFPKFGKTDTILVPWVLYEGEEWMPYKQLPTIDMHCKASIASIEAKKARDRLVNAVLVTYPYALYAAKILRQIDDTLKTKTTNKEKKQYIKSQEQFLKDKFEKPLTNLSTYQGNILFKLINRETGNSCYEIIKMYKSGITAFFWQSVGKLWGNDLKQIYDPQNNEQDTEIEQIVYQIQINQRY